MFYFDLPTFAQNVFIKSIYSRDFWCSAKEAVILLLLRQGSCFIASFAEHPICSNSKMYSVLILVVLFWFIDIYPKCVKKKHLFSQFQVLHKGSRDIASFVEHPVSSNFKMYSVLILVVLFWSTNICPKCVYKKHLFSRFLVLCKRSSDITSSATRKLFYCFFRGAPYM